jgi:ectoine hydroxylase-related dioxygenase (phytanoyl-CoA dioxygenase family)
LVNNAIFDYQGIRELALSSPLPALAGQLFGSTKVNFVFDQVFIKEPGALSRTAFHQDQGYFKVDGQQVATFWTAVEPVDEMNGRMGYVRGSHRWGMHAPNMFVSQITGESHGLDQLPDIEGHEDDFDVVYFDVAPGDVIVHDYRTVHGSRGNITTDRVRRAAAIRYAGDDVTFLDRPSARGEFPVDPNVGDGDPLDSETFPVVWRSSEP